MQDVRVLANYENEIQLGSLIFLTPEDIVELRAKLILTFVGSLMALQIK